MSLKNKIIGALLGGSLLGSTLTIVVHKNEGYSESAYKDSAGVWTICYGETSGVKPHQRASKAECDAQLVKSLSKHAEALSGLPESLPDVVVLGSTDAAYNIGVHGFRTSSAYKSLSKGDYAEASQNILKFRYISRSTKPAKSSGWDYRKGRWYFDCSTPGNTVCMGLWKRRVWQSKAIGNEFNTLQEAVHALPK